MKNFVRNLIIYSTLTGLAVLLFFSNGGGGLTAHAQTKDAGAAITCKEAMLNNYQIQLSQCSDKQTWELDCQFDNQKQSYQCSCKKAGTETKKMSMTERPYKITPESMEQTHQNAVAGANKICGFNLKYQPK